MTCPANKASCPCLEFAKENLCDWPYKKGMTFEELEAKRPGLKNHNTIEGLNGTIRDILPSIEHPGYLLPRGDLYHRSQRFDLWLSINEPADID